MSVYPLVKTLALQWGMNKLEEPALFSLGWARAYTADRDQQERMQRAMRALELPAQFEQLVRRPHTSVCAAHIWRVIPAIGEAAMVLSLGGRRSKGVYALALLPLVSRVVSMLRDWAERKDYSGAKRTLSSLEYWDRSVARPLWRVATAAYAMDCGGYRIGKWSKGMLTLMLITYFVKKFFKSKDQNQLTRDGRNERLATLLVDLAETPKGKTFTEREPIADLLGRINPLERNDFPILSIGMPRTMQESCRQTFRRIHSDLSEQYQKLYATACQILNENFSLETFQQLQKDPGFELGLITADATPKFKTD